MFDFHTYPTLVREMVQGNADLERASRDVFDIGNNFQPLEVFHLQMDAGGVETAVILPIASKRAYGVDVFNNEQIAELVKMSGRFVGFASVDPGESGAADKLKADVKKFDLRGVNLMPGMQQFDPYSKEAYAVYETTKSLGIPILFETGMSWQPDTPLEPGRPIHFEKLIRDFRDVPIVLAHLGWPWVGEAVALALKYDNVYLDTSALYHDHPLEFGYFIFNHLIPKTVIERSLRDRVLMGSCYPRMEIKHAIEILEGGQLNTDAIEQIAFVNARQLLKL